MLSCPIANQHSQLGELEGLELREVRESLRMKYDVGLLNFFSTRPRDVLPDNIAGTHNY
mgnify:CR=1 FL=1